MWLQVVAFSGSHFWLFFFAETNVLKETENFFQAKGKEIFFRSVAFSRKIFLLPKIFFADENFRRIFFKNGMNDDENANKNQTCRIGMGNRFLMFILN